MRMCRDCIFNKHIATVIDGKYVGVNPMNKLSYFNILKFLHNILDLT